MSKNKMPLTEEIAKYIFPGTEPEVAEGEDGDIIYDFKRLYPSKLAIFVPNEVEKSNYSAVFPRPFESYFVNIFDELEYLSRMLEVPIHPDLPDVGIECVFGSVVSPINGVYTVFRFDELLEVRKRTFLLCRTPLNSIGIADRMYILNTEPIFTQEANDIATAKYYYWIMKLDKLFFQPTEILAATFAFADSLRKR